MAVGVLIVAKTVLVIAITVLIMAVRALMMAVRALIMAGWRGTAAEKISFCRTLRFR
jgi:hypothetical protein